MIRAKTMGGWVALLGAVVSPVAGAAEYFVAPDGENGDTGLTIDHPG